MYLSKLKAFCEWDHTKYILYHPYITQYFVNKSLITIWTCLDDLQSVYYYILDVLARLYHFGHLSGIRTIPMVNGVAYDNVFQLERS